ncbi:hypothetical protein [Noviherbaspirillum massiliense]|uniref:hypothetical protein n=1 Tax=Noviherbaspirillum massiliense TaxID=1465823 RepID=UPI001CA34864|nr:hypothetical protein [Noviherbaspirillum massiliense]
MDSNLAMKEALCTKDGINLILSYVETADLHENVYVECDGRDCLWEYVMHRDESIASLLEWLSPKLTVDELDFLRTQLDSLAENAKRYGHLLERDSHSLYAVVVSSINQVAIDQEETLKIKKEK